MQIKQFQTQKSDKDKKPVSAILDIDYYNFIKKNNLNIRKLIEAKCDDLGFER